MAKYGTHWAFNHLFYSALVFIVLFIITADNMKKSSKFNDLDPLRDRNVKKRNRDNEE